MNDYDLQFMNNRNDLKFWEQYDRIYKDNVLNDDPYFGLNIDCRFHTVESLASFAKGPIYISINVQSLLSKYDQLVEFINELYAAKISIDVIAVQEIWDICYPELVNIPGFQTLAYKTRRNMRGGGVGFYVRNNLNFQVLEELSPFANKIFESLTINLTYPASKKSVLLTCAYRSNGIIPHMPPSQQLDEFFGMFGDLLAQIQNSNKESYIFIDANLNLLDLNSAENQNYLNLLFATGFLQGIVKATRIQNLSKSLIDHILFNKIASNIAS
jgi:hypothetical protein